MVIPPPRLHDCLDFGDVGSVADFVQERWWHSPKLCPELFRKQTKVLCVAGETCALLRAHKSLHAADSPQKHGHNVCIAEAVVGRKVDAGGSWWREGRSNAHGKRVGLNRKLHARRKDHGVHEGQGNLRIQERLAIPHGGGCIEV